LSGTLVVTTLFSGFNAARTAIWTTAGLTAGAAATGAWLWLTRSRRPPREPHPREAMSEADRMRWRMPPLALLKPVDWSAGTKMGVLLLRGYLVVSVILLVVKAVELGSHG